jgi:hypothetical protein
MGLTVATNGAPARTTTHSFRESVLSIQRSIEDLNWVNLSTDERMENALPLEERKRNMREAREYIKTNPLAKQGSALLVNYTLGRGVTLTAANKNLVGRLVDEFWFDPINRETFTSNTSMAEFIQGAFTDGAQYLVLFPDEKEGTLQLGALDAYFVEDIVFDEENWRIPLWFKVRKPKASYDFKGEAGRQAEGDDEFVWYRHWRNDRPLDSKGKKAPAKVEPGLMYMAKRGKGKWGVSEIQAAAPWLRAHKQFMKDRVTLTKAAAAIAWKKKLKNASQSDVNSEVSRVQSTLYNATYGSEGYERNPAPTSGSSYIENENSTLEWVKTDLASANDDERILRMMVGSGMGGIPNHYFGDEADANLASATSMELPLLKSYEGWQQWLTDIIKDITDFMLSTAHEAGRLGDRDDSSRYADRSLTQEKVLDTTAAAVAPRSDGGTNKSGNGNGQMREAFPQPGQQPQPGMPPPPPPRPLEDVTFQVPEAEPKKGDKVDWYVDVDFPPIVVKDIQPYFESLTKLNEMMPGTPEGKKLVLSMALTAAGVNDVDQVLGNLFPPLPPGVKPTMAQQAMPGLLQQGPQVKGLLPAGPSEPNPPGPSQQAQREAADPIRVHRFLNVVREAARQAEIVEGEYEEV